jgi:hypothetical protein
VATDSSTRYEIGDALQKLTGEFWTKKKMEEKGKD